MFAWLICYDRIFPLTEYKYADIEWNSQHNLTEWIYVSTFYGKYLSMLDLLMHLSSISLHFRGKSALPLVDYLGLTVIHHSMPIITFQPSHQNSETYSDKMSKLLKN